MRNSRDWLISVSRCLILTLSFSTLAAAQQVNPYLKQRLEQVLTLENQLTPEQIEQMPSGIRNWFALAHQVLDPVGSPTEDEDGGMPGGFSGTRTATTTTLKVQNIGAASVAGLVPVSAASFDYMGSRVFGFTQNDSASAWCGSSIVTAFNSSAAQFITFNNGGAFSAISTAYSSDGGKNFSDLGFLTAGPTGWNAVSGTPVTLCTNPSTFYIAAGYGTVDSNFQFLNGIGISASTNAGKSWSEPTPAVLKNYLHIVDKQWLAIDPANPNRFYLAYSDFNFDRPTSGDCAGDLRVSVEFVKSTDGGKTWSQPQVLSTVCRGQDDAVEGAQVLVAPNGSVHVAYLRRFNEAQSLVIRSSNDAGTTFTPESKISDVSPVGVENFLQGFFRNNQYPSLAVDRSTGPSKGALYVAWTDGRNRSQFDMMAPGGRYNFGDVLLARSTDNGATWSQPVAVSPTSSNFRGAGRDQFMPSVAVDKNGTVAVCYSDRSNDPGNTAIDRYCAVSQDHGASFVTSRKTPSNWIPSHYTDIAIDSYFIGDYDTVTSDASGKYSGFFSGLQVQVNNNPNVYGVRF